MVVFSLRTPLICIKKGLLEKAGFVNMIWKFDEESAPLGAILTYVGGVGHRYGHIEVRVNCQFILQ